jgi:HK97 family phage major capsid protein
MPSQLEALGKQHGDLIAAADAIVAAAENDKRDLTPEELAEIKAKTAEAKSVKEQMAAVQQAERDRAEALAELTNEREWGNQTQASIVQPQPQPQHGGIGEIISSRQAPTQIGTPNTHTFPSFGHHLQAVAAAGVAKHPSEWDPRLQAAVSGLNEGVASQGGFLVSTDMATGLLERTYNNNLILNGGAGYGGCTKVPISANANGGKFNALNETSRADGSRFGGVRAYYAAEAATKTDSKPEFRQMELSLKKLIGLYYATDELLQDASALEALCANWFAQEFAFKTQDSLYAGLGGGVPLGILPSPCLISQAKETGQAAATIVKENIDKMWSRMWTAGLPNSVWHINQMCYPQLFSLSQAVGTGGMPVYLPPGGLSQSPFGTLMGRPVVPLEQCLALGTKGDIAFCDWSQMLHADKNAMESASSIHVRFVYDETAFRFVYRHDCQPAWNAALTPYKGGATATTGPFIVLADRS